jgi:hypothetical protein
MKRRRVEDEVDFEQENGEEVVVFFSSLALLRLSHSIMIRRLQKESTL